MVWLTSSRDIPALEARFCALTRSERPDPQFLRSAEWFAIRRQLIRYLDEGDTAALHTGMTFRMTPLLRLVVLGAYPENACVAEAELFFEDAAPIPQAEPAALGCDLY